MTTWIVVANAGAARLFETKADDDVVELETLVNPYNRLHEQDLVSDRHGQSRNSTSMKTEGYEPPSAKKHEQERFASQLAAHLEQAYNDHRFKTLYLVCSPTFLGQIRSRLSANVCQVIKAELHKNMVTHSVPEILALLPRHLTPMM